MRVAVLAEALGANTGIGHALSVARTNLDTPQLYALALCSMLLVGVADDEGDKAFDPESFPAAAPPGLQVLSL